jgi:primary-amine oxidase
MIAPQNFFDEAQDGDLQNRQWILPSTGGTSLNANSFGVSLATCAVDLEQPSVGKVSKA